MARLNWCELNKQYFDPASCSGKNGLYGMSCDYADEDGKCLYKKSTEAYQETNRPRKTK